MINPVTDVLDKQFNDWDNALKGPTLNAKDYEYVGTAFPWHVFKPIGRKAKTPERRYVACCRYIEEDGSITLFTPMIPLTSYPS